MKRILLFLFILSTIVGAKALNIIYYDPFQKAKVLLKNPSIEKALFMPKILSIDAILNKKVYIDGKFYDVGSVVYGYQIISIKDKYIKVKKNGKISTILLIKSNNFDNISVEG